jgi:hypothetical protein
MTCGIISSLYVDECRELAWAFNLDFSEYTVALSHCGAGIRSWAKSVGYKAKIAYFFEAGHARQEEANIVMAKMLDNDAIRFSYLSHSFVYKLEARPLHTPDMLAWYWAKHLAGEPVREDLKVLTADGTHYSHHLAKGPQNYPRPLHRCKKTLFPLIIARYDELAGVLRESVVLRGAQSCSAVDKQRTSRGGG